MASFMGNVIKEEITNNGALIGYTTCAITVKNIAVDAESETPSATVDLSGVIDIFVYSNGGFIKTASLPVTASEVALQVAGN